VGKINKEIVGLINLHGGRAVGLSGKDASLLRAHKRPHKMPDGSAVDIGLVGEVEAVNAEAIKLLGEGGFVPGVAPVGGGAGGRGGCPARTQASCGPTSARTRCPTAARSTSASWARWRR